MDISNINALSRYGAYPTSRTAGSGAQSRAVADAMGEAIPVVRAARQPVEQVLQGELLQKRRKASSYDAMDLLDSMRAMDMLMRDTSGTSSDTAPPRDARRAIASYTQQSIIPNTLTGATAAAVIDYFV